MLLVHSDGPQPLRLIRGVHVNMSPRTAVMVAGKVFSGLLRPVRRGCQVLMLAMFVSILQRIWLTVRL